MVDKLGEAMARRAAQRDLPNLDRCRELREAHGLTRADLAEALDVSAATVSRWERGLRRPRGAEAVTYLKALRRLAHELGESL